MDGEEVELTYESPSGKQKYGSGKNGIRFRESYMDKRGDRRGMRRGMRRGIRRGIREGDS